MGNSDAPQRISHPSRRGGRDAKRARTYIASNCRWQHCQAEALDSIPQHLAEIGWDRLDVPSLFVIRFPAGENEFPAVVVRLGDRASSLKAIRIHGASEVVDPWPPIFISNVSAATLSPEDMQLFQVRWCLRRSQSDPAHHCPRGAQCCANSSGRNRTAVRPFRAPGQTAEIQSGRDRRRLPVEMVGLILSKGSGRLRRKHGAPGGRGLATGGGGQLGNTLLRWSNPYPNNFDPNWRRTRRCSFPPGAPCLCGTFVDSHRRVLWEHRFGADADKLRALRVSSRAGLQTKAACAGARHQILTSELDRRARRRQYAGIGRQREARLGSVSIVSVTLQRRIATGQGWKLTLSGGGRRHSRRRWQCQQATRERVDHQAP